MKKNRAMWWVLSGIPLVTSISSVVACSTPKSGGEGEDEIKPKNYNFLQEVVDETWSDIDVRGESLQDWLIIKNLYEDEVTRLNQENIDSPSENRDIYKYYKNLFYIAWYLRIIGKVNLNISWLKFESLHGDIIENDDKDANFTFALYVQHQTPITYNWDTERKLQNYFFSNLMKYQPGGLLETDLEIPNNYLNFTQHTNKITYQQIARYYRGHMKNAEKDNIDKVFDYFLNNLDKVKYQPNIDANSDALAIRWKNNNWRPHPAISTDGEYFDWLGPWKVNEQKVSIPDFDKPSWEEWIK